MIHRAQDLSPEQEAAAELLLGRPLRDEESITVQAFEEAPASEERRREEVSAELRKLFAEVDRNPEDAHEVEAESVFTEAMLSSRLGYRTRW